MKLPRDLSGRALAAALAKLGYAIDHQTGSHLRLTTLRGGEHRVTVPLHDALKVGTLAGILREVAAHQTMSRDKLLRELFG
ncbi:MAG: type II toxin-antitoxin system HicA family toxin [Phycisphaerales bacterium]|nr:type II toxin-antitoxin system HicA family toxin [Phycisphaerales bacterium]